MSQDRKNREGWNRERYAEEIARLRRQAGDLRKDAERKDRQADKLRDECAAKSTENLPLFPPVQ